MESYADEKPIFSEKGLTLKELSVNKVYKELIAFLIKQT